MFKVDVDLANVKNLPEEYKNAPGIGCQTHSKDSPIVKLLERWTGYKEDGTPKRVTTCLGYIMDNQFFTKDEYKLYYDRCGHRKEQLSRVSPRQKGLRRGNSRPAQESAADTPADSGPEERQTEGTAVQSASPQQTGQTESSPVPQNAATEAAPKRRGRPRKIQPQETVQAVTAAVADARPEERLPERAAAQNSSPLQSEKAEFSEVQNAATEAATKHRGRPRKFQPQETAQTPSAVSAKRPGRPPKTIPGAVHEPGVSYRFMPRSDGSFDVYKVWSRYNPERKNNSAYSRKHLGISPVRDDLRFLSPSVQDRKKQVQALQETAASCVSSSSCKYPAHAVLLVLLMTYLQGTRSCQAVQTYWVDRQEELEKFFPGLPKEAPSHDTIRRIIKRVGEENGNPVLAGMLAGYIRHRLLNGNLENILCDQRCLHLDGQAVRAARNKDDRIPYALNLYDSTLGCVLSHVSIGEKHNEITYATELIAAQNLKNCIVTCDALNTQANFIRKIREKGGDYCVAVKSNHSALEEALKYVFSHMDTIDSSLCKSYTVGPELGHGRVETRTVTVLPASLLGTEFHEKWADLEYGSLVMATTSTEKKKTGEPLSCIERLYISSLNPEEEDVASTLYHVIRSHWSVETMHWGLDVIYCQDKLQCTDNSFIMGMSTILKLVDLIARNDIAFEKRAGLPAQETTRPVHEQKMRNSCRALLAILRTLCPQGA